jgi:hypothetical protein
MSYIPTLVASLDTRLDELADEISTLEHARAALRTATLAATPMAAVDSRAKGTRRARSARKTKQGQPEPRAAGIDPKPELVATAATGSRSGAAKPRRRASVPRTPRKPAVSSLSADQLERLLADAGSGLSAGTIAEQTGVSYSRVLAQLRTGEAAGQLRRTGRRRSTLWSLITDEDRVAARAAELERLVGARGVSRIQRRGRARAS